MMPDVQALRIWSRTQTPLCVTPPCEGAQANRRGLLALLQRAPWGSVELLQRLPQAQTRPHSRWGRLELPTRPFSLGLGDNNAATTTRTHVELATQLMSLPGDSRLASRLHLPLHLLAAILILALLFAWRRRSQSLSLPPPTACTSALESAGLVQGSPPLCTPPTGPQYKRFVSSATTPMLSRSFAFIPSRGLDMTEATVDRKTASDPLRIRSGSAPWRRPKGSRDDGSWISRRQLPLEALEPGGAEDADASSAAPVEASAPEVGGDAKVGTEAEEVGGAEAEEHQVEVVLTKPSVITPNASSSDSYSPSDSSSPSGPASPSLRSSPASSLSTSSSLGTDEEGTEEPGGRADDVAAEDTPVGGIVAGSEDDDVAAEAQQQQPFRTPVREEPPAPTEDVYTAQYKFMLGSISRILDTASPDASPDPALLTEADRHTTVLGVVTPPSVVAARNHAARSSRRVRSRATRLSHELVLPRALLLLSPTLSPGGDSTAGESPTAVGVGRRRRSRTRLRLRTLFAAAATVAPIRKRVSSMVVMRP